MKGALLPGTEADQPHGRFDPDEFYREHRDELLSYFAQLATARLGSMGAHIAEDLLHDTWLKLRDKYQQIDTSQPRQVVAWCKEVGTNRLADLLRRGYHSREEPHSELVAVRSERGAAAHVNPEDQWAVDADVLRVVEKMPDKLAKVFLYDYLGLSREQIAERLGIKPSTVGARLTRARAYARNQFGKIVAALLPVGALTQAGRAVRRTLGRPSQVLVTGIGSLSVVVAFGVPIAPGTVELPARATQGVVAHPMPRVTPPPPAAHSTRHPGAGRTSAASAPAHGQLTGKQAPHDLVPHVPKTCGPHICVSSDCPGSPEAGDRVYLKPMNDPCGVAIVESYAPACQYVAHNPVVGCHREGDPHWAVNPPPSPITKGGPL